MRLRSIKSKLLFSSFLGIALLAVAQVGWLLHTFSAANDREVRRRLAAFAESSTIMVHSAAGEYAARNHLRFYRLLPSDTPSDPVLAELRDRILRASSNNGTVDTTVDGPEGRKIYVFTAAVVSGECLGCHQSMGVTALEGKNAGSVAAVFGVTGAPAEVGAAETGVQRNVWLGTVFLIVGLLAGSFVAFSRILDVPLRELVGLAKALASGELRRRAAYKADDEIGDVASAIEEASKRITEILTLVRTTLDEVSSASAGLSSGMGQITTVSRHQAEQTAEIAAAIEELAKAATETASNSSGMSGLAAEVDYQAQAGATQVREVVEGVRTLAVTVQNYSTTILAMKESNGQIEGILQVIEDIADQTNLLALNAAIEAARAGDQGRGFAVVADEVRKLAERTAKATKEIGTMIAEIQRNTVTAFDQVEQGIAKADVGISAAERAEATLNGIADMAQSTSDAVKQIAAATEEQSATVEQFTKTLHAMNTSSEESGTSVAEMGRANENLGRRVHEVHGLIGWFTMDAPHTPAGPGGRSGMVRRSGAAARVNADDGVTEIQHALHED